MNRLLIILLLVSFSFGSLSQEKILLSRATVHTGNGIKINQGLVGIQDDKIILVENALTYSLDKEVWDTIIDLKGKHVYPAFFAPNSNLGLTEIDAVRATNDYDEVGAFNPHIRSLIAFNAESKVSATVKTNGVLYAQAAPTGGIISGSSSVMKLEAWNWEDAVVKADDGIHLNWPATLQGGGWWAEPAPKKKNKKYAEQVTRIEDFFKAARSYAKKHDEFDQRFDAMQEVFNGEKRLYIHANELKALIDAVDFSKEMEVQFPVIVGGYDAHLIARELIDAEIPVIIKGGHELPQNDDDPVDMQYRLPKMLKDAGVKFCIQSAGSMPTMNSRNIPFLAGTAMAYGLSEEEAIRSVSLSTAEILGVGDKVGSIEKGKLASLFVSEGDALDMRTNDVTMAMINGKFLNLTNHQIKLYEKYKEKYEEN
tara:strand:+ start:51786 stop:53060 length:1275 start_codon:yes stop_codon:yes gene_type:complete